MVQHVRGEVHCVVDGDDQVKEHIAVWGVVREGIWPPFLSLPLDEVEIGVVVLAAAEADGGDGKQTELVVRRKEGADEIWADEIEGETLEGAFEVLEC